MDRSDDEFEAFLRQFRPRKPKALPTHRGSVVTWATAAVIVAAVVATTRYGSWGSAVNDSNRAPVSAPAGGTTPAGRMTESGPRNEPRTTPNRTPDANTRSPRLSPLGTLKQPVSPAPSNGPVSAANGVAARRVRVGAAVRAPLKVFDVRPMYPEDAQAAGISGVVILGIVIGEDGSVIDTEVLRSIPELDQAAIDAVNQWLFEPTLLNGEPVEVEMSVTVQFTLAG